MRCTNYAEKVLQVKSCFKIAKERMSKFWFI